LDGCFWLLSTGHPALPWLLRRASARRDTVHRTSLITIIESLGLRKP
jgi:hypothetical protein